MKESSHPELVFARSPARPRSLQPGSREGRRPKGRPGCSSARPPARIPREYNHHRRRCRRRHHYGNLARNPPPSIRRRRRRCYCHRLPRSPRVSPAPAPAFWCLASIALSRPRALGARQGSCLPPPLLVAVARSLAATAAETPNISWRRSPSSGPRPPPRLPPSLDRASARATGCLPADSIKKRRDESAVRGSFLFAACLHARDAAAAPV